MRYRDHRGSLNESMETVKEFTTKDELGLHLKELHPYLNGKITIEPYAFDKRIGWDTHIVCIGQHGVGFTDGGIV